MRDLRTEAERLTLSYGLATALEIGRLQLDGEALATYERVARRKAIWMSTVGRARDCALILLCSAVTIGQFWVTVAAAIG